MDPKFAEEVCQALTASDTEAFTTSVEYREQRNALYQILKKIVNTGTVTPEQLEAAKAVLAKVEAFL